MGLVFRFEVWFIGIVGIVERRGGEEDVVVDIDFFVNEEEEGTEKYGGISDGRSGGKIDYTH